jgi:exodeoxyribonuclease VII large subunit
MQQETSAISQPVLVFSPSEVLAQYRNSLHSTFDGVPVCVSGFYEPGTGPEYKSGFYDNLIDTNKENKLTIIVSATDRTELVTGGFYSFVGFLEKGQVTQDSKLRLQMKVQQVVGYDKTRKQFSESDYDVLKERMDKGFLNVERKLTKILRKNQKASIVIITGLDSKGEKDFYTALGDMESEYNITLKKTNMSSGLQISNILSELQENDWTLLAFMRGGGIGLEVFNDMKLCSAALDCGIPFIIAIGHEADKPVLDRLSDRSFSTPTAFGNFLKELAENVIQELNEAEDTRLSVGLIRAELKGKEDQIEQMRLDFDRKTADSQKQAKNLYLIIAGVVILLVVSLWVK